MRNTGIDLKVLVLSATEVHLHLLLHCAKAAPTLLLTPTAPLAAAIRGAGSVDDLASASRKPWGRWRRRSCRSSGCRGYRRKRNAILAITGTGFASGKFLASLRSLANLSRQASVCWEPFPRQALQPGVSPNLMILFTVMYTALDFTSLVIGGGALPACNPQILSKWV